MYNPSQTNETATAEVTIDALNAEVQTILGDGAEFPDELDAAIGEVCVPFSLPTFVPYPTRLTDACRARAPTADLPNMAAFLGGLVAQEAINVITEQYVPLNGYCVVDLIDSWTGVVG